MDWPQITFLVVWTISCVCIGWTFGRLLLPPRVVTRNVVQTQTQLQTTEKKVLMLPEDFDPPLSAENLVTVRIAMLPLSKEEKQDLERYCHERLKK